MSEIDSLQTTIAAEHAAVFVLAYLGAQTSQTASPTLFTDLDGAYTAHRGRRDQLARVIRALGAEPAVSAPAYRLPGAGDTDAVKRAARRIEKRCAATYFYLVGTTADDVRALAVGYLVDAAVRELDFGGKPETLPGT